ncbi:uncharacterized protein PGTG_18807 [Puccinia graminis f. sp. tritici CRL 75-36-700-3]|uniref:Peptidase A2 domain-containing protein n=1 Tax=Puccinia graminis f. sp. tritici (strain CRL 75-36-700-3 / race SCCL) TaxID=418459 RepID=E3L8L4_PUCGT|nr:uncharacterized protein PGTG_18807 [Puccinia graminis f. sp. tritici CRL 75-36-700-3]EFP92889.2 hypothetical protein PGTG_18807 [Puccinia graminis f. sp. tritici CRL 75-36-700-3]
MRVSKDGGNILPVTKIIVQYIQREVQSTSVMERRSLGRLEQTKTERVKPAKNPVPRPPAPAPPSESYEKKIQDLTRQLASLTAGKMAPPHQPLDANLPPSAAPNNIPFKKPDFKCYYCFQDTHSSNRCSLFTFDESRGLVKQEGRDYLLPDNTKIAWDTCQAIKDKVDKFECNSKKTTAAVVTSLFGELEECEIEEHAAYDVDLGKRMRSEKELEKSGSGKRGRVEKDAVMDIDAEDLIKKATTQKSAQGPSKTTTIPAKEYPGVEEETVKRMLTEGKMTLSYGEIFSILNGVVDVFKNKISNRRVPVKESESSNHASLANNEEDKLSVTHYSCPLGYIKHSINGANSKALLDTGLMVNLMPEHMAQNLGLVIAKKPMNLKGIGGHQTGIIGITESQSGDWENN